MQSWDPTMSWAPFERAVENMSEEAEVLPPERSFDSDPVFPYMSQDVAEMHFYTRAPE